MKAEETIPVVYARALLEGAADQGILEEIEDEVTYFAKLLDEHRDLRVFIENPRLEKSVKRKVIEDALRSRISDLFVNFLLLLVEKGRQMYLRDILEEFGSLYDDKVGRTRAVAVSAVPLPEQSMAETSSALADKTGRQILLTNQVDPSILGGLVIRYQGMVADGSLKTALEGFRSSMMSIKLGSEYVHED